MGDKGLSPLYVNDMDGDPVAVDTRELDRLGLGLGLGLGLRIGRGRGARVRASARVRDGDLFAVDTRERDNPYWTETLPYIVTLTGHEGTG